MLWLCSGFFSRIGFCRDRRRALAFLFFLTLSLKPGLSLAAETAQSTDEASRPPRGGDFTNAPIHQVASNQWVIGKVRLDQSRRTVAFPAFVNLREGVIEYLVVADYGKIHESLLRTDVLPMHIQLALVLLGAKGAGTNGVSEDPTRALPGDRMTIDVSWRKGRRLRRLSAGELVFDRKANRTLRHPDWVYTGSRFREDGFAAQADGSIVSLITDPDALVNNGGRGRDDDDNWLAAAKRLPERDSPVEITLTLIGQ